MKIDVEFKEVEKLKAKFKDVYMTGNSGGSASCCLTKDDALAILDETGVAKAIVDENGIIVTDADNRILIY